MTELEDESVKLEVLAKLKEGTKPQVLVQDFGISYSRVLKWRRELKEAEETGTVNKLLQIDKIVLQRVADEVEKEIQQLNIVEDEPINEEIAVEIEGEVEKAVDSIKGLQLLDTSLQQAAILIIDKIKEKTIFVEETKDLYTLTEALAKLQNAFFNKPQTNVNILNNNNVSNDGLQKFRGLMRD